MGCSTTDNSRIVSMGSKIVGKQQKALSSVFTERKRQEARSTVKVSILYSQFEPLSYRVPLVTKDVVRSVFIPSTVNILNTAE